MSISPALLTFSGSCLLLLYSAVLGVLAHSLHLFLFYLCGLVYAVFNTHIVLTMSQAPFFIRQGKEILPFLPFFYSGIGDILKWNSHVFSRVLSSCIWPALFPFISGRTGVWGLLTLLQLCVHQSHSLRARGSWEAGSPVHPHLLSPFVVGQLPSSPLLSSAVYLGSEEA